MEDPAWIMTVKGLSSPSKNSAKEVEEGSQSPLSKSPPSRFHPSSSQASSPPLSPRRESNGVVPREKVSTPVSF